MLHKILYHESGSGFGGSAISLYRLIKCLDKTLFQPVVLVHGVGPRIEELQKMNVSITVLRSYSPIPQITIGTDSFYKNFIETLCFYTNFASTCLINAIKISRIIKKQNISLVHLSNGIFENFPSLVAARLCGIPCVSHVKGTVPLLKLERMFGGWLRKIITLNGEMYNLYVSVFGAEKSCIVFEGVDIDAFEEVDKGKLRREYQVRQNHFLVGTIARLVPGKGIPEFIKAAAEVIKVNQDVIFFIIGDDPNSGHFFEDILKGLSRELGISDHIVFTGWRNDAIDLMSGLDLVVQVSTFPEGMSLVPLEAMALGKPVIASNVPGYTDTVEHGVTGCIVPPGDTSALAKEILRLAADKNLAKRLGTSGRQKVLKEFDARIMAEKIQSIYKSILL